MVLGWQIRRLQPERRHLPEGLERSRGGRAASSTNSLAVPKSWSPDGRYLIYAQIDPGTGADLFALPVEGNRHPLVLAQTAANEDQGQFSPDGNWVAYTSNESGLSEI
jgi:Tol biopolymer transport system component